MNIDSVVVWCVLMPIGAMLWCGFAGFLVWLATEPLAYTAEQIALSWRKHWPKEKTNAVMLSVMDERAQLYKSKVYDLYARNGHAGELASAAVSYLVHDPLGSCNAVPGMWPWVLSSFKPENNQRNLVKAAALVLAELDRVERMQWKDAK